MSEIEIMAQNLTNVMCGTMKLSSMHCLHIITPVRPGIPK